MKALDRYLLLQIMPTLLITLFIAAVVLSMDRLMRLLDIAVDNGVSTLVVFQMLFNLVPDYIGFALPVGLFLGVLLAFRKLSMQCELDAISASGIGISRFIRPALALAAIIMFLNFVLSGYVQPYTRYAYREILFKITSGVIEQGIGEGVFMNLPNGYTLRVEESRSAGRELYGVFAHKQDRRRPYHHAHRQARRTHDRRPRRQCGAAALRRQPVRMGPRDQGHLHRCSSGPTIGRSTSPT